MSIILNETTPVLVQGITGRIATFTPPRCSSTAPT